MDKCREAFESKYRELRPDDKCTMMENGNYSGWIKQAHWWMWQSRQAEVDEHHKINVALNSETIKQREQIRHYMNQCVEKGKRITNATEQLNGFMRMIQEDLICDESLSNLLIVNLKGLEKALRGDNA